MSRLFSRNSRMAVAASLIIVVGVLLADTPKGASSASAAEAPVYKWNVADKAQPLLGLSLDHLRAGFAQSLSYPVQGACNA